MIEPEDDITKGLANQWISVESSNLAAILYRPKERELEIRFKNGQGIYEGVPPEIAQALLEADSKGIYHARMIKHSFPYKRL